MNKKAVIFGIKGIELTKDESNLIKISKPWGIILFSRNIKNLPQLKKLISQIKFLVNNKNYPILIDQEGGVVSRLNDIIDFSPFSQNYFGNLYNTDKKKFFNYYKIYINSICNIFKEVGININTLPVLDVRRKFTHSIIGTRSFSNNPKIVSEIGKICIKLHENNKIATVIKHIPGHGLAKQDSHLSLPIVKNKKKDLIHSDFSAFKQNISRQTIKNS